MKYQRRRYSHHSPNFPASHLDPLVIVHPTFLQVPSLNESIKEIEQDAGNIFELLSEKFSAADICLYRIQYLRAELEDVYFSAQERSRMAQEELSSTDYEYQVVLASPMADERSAWIKHQTDELLSGNKAMEKSINSLG